jgi:hypothetical protein
MGAGMIALSFYLVGSLCFAVGTILTMVAR